MNIYTYCLIIVQISFSKLQGQVTDYTSMCYRGGVLFTYFEWQDQAIQQVLDTPFPIYCLLFIVYYFFAI